MQKPENVRHPNTDEELAYWLRNMIWYHRLTTDEVRAATGLSEPEIIAAQKKFEIRSDNPPARDETARLLVLPYPGGRHPRIGFLEGAIDPQRETKFSVFTAWENCHRPWGNEECPCFHSDPKFPDLEPGQRHRLRGWLSFYEGDDVQAEFARIEATGWRAAEK